MTGRGAQVAATVRDGNSDDDVVCGLIVGAAAGASVYAPRLPHAAAHLNDLSPLELGVRSRVVAEIAGRPIGFADYRPQDGHIKYLFVHPEAQGSGAGSALLDAVQARVGGPVSVHVLALNDAGILWYLRRGLKVVDGWEEDFEGQPAAWLRMVRDAPAGHGRREPHARSGVP